MMISEPCIAVFAVFAGRFYNKIVWIKSSLNPINGNIYYIIVD